MQTSYFRFVSWMGAVAIALSIIPGAAAQCGLSVKAIKPSGWQPGYEDAYQRLVLVDQEASIVGMWHVIFTAQTLNGEPFSGVIDNSVVVWHSDGTEIMNSSRPAQDGNFCLGVWDQTGPFRYKLNHFALSYDEEVGCVGAHSLAARMASEVPRPRAVT